MAKRPTQHYVDNEKFLQAIADYRNKCNEAEENGKPIPQVTNYIGECFIKISKNVGNSRNFSNYPFREDMEGDAIINCLSCVRNFDTDTYDNPFAYFTTVVRNAYLERIAIEKKKLYVVFKASREMIPFGTTYDTGGEDVPLNLNVSSDYIDDYIQDFEDKVAEKQERLREKAREKKKNEQSYIEQFFIDDSGDTKEDNDEDMLDN